MKKFLAFLLALMMITSLACVPVSAEDVQPAADQTEEVVVEPDVGVPIELPPETTIEFIPEPVVGSRGRCKVSKRSFVSNKDGKTLWANDIDKFYAPKNATPEGTQQSAPAASGYTPGKF